LSFFSDTAYKDRVMMHVLLMQLQNCNSNQAIDFDKSDNSFRFMG